MPKVVVLLDNETHAVLLAQAVAERRPLALQAEVAIRRALGLPVPVPTSDTADEAS